MAVSLLQYRAWHGTFARPLWAVWPIARESLRTLFRRKLFWVLYAAGLLIFLMFFFGGYLLDWALTQVPSEPIRIGKLQTEPERLVQSLKNGVRVLNGSQDTFAYFFLYQGAMVVIVLALTGAITVGNDYLHGSMPFYLAKPLSRWHYILGKCLAVGVVVNMLTTLPALLLYAQRCLDDWNYFLDVDFFWRRPDGHGPASWPLLLGILGYGGVLTVCLSLLLVATASWVQRTVSLVLVWTTLFLFLRTLANLLVDGLRLDEHWRLIDLWNNLRLLGCACLSLEHERIAPQPQPSFVAAGLVLGGVCLLCLSYLNLRTRAVSIVK